MLLINDATPRWIRELDRFIHLKSLLFVHGNVLDLVSYQVAAEGGRNYWTESNLRGFFERYLSGLGYEIVGLFDPVEGLSFALPAMQKLYDAIAEGRPVSPEDRQAARNQESGGEMPLRRPPTPGGLVELEPIMGNMAKVLANREVPAAFVCDFASRLVAAPDRLSRQEQALFTRILKAALDSREAWSEHGRWNNVLLLACDKQNDLPPFLYLDNPRARSIHIEKPGTSERSRFLKSNYPSFYGGKPGEEPSAELTGLFAALTEGFSYYEMLSLIGLSQREQISVEKIRGLCERFKYGITESEWDKLDKRRLDQAGALIRGRIKGQEIAVLRLLEIVKRAKLGLAAGGSGKRPRGVLFFAGPTGVGKTEMAKGLAELLFGQEERLIRFDMSEYAAAHADQKLLGAPPGYVGYEEGGKLTNAVKTQPFSVLLFDEIEKAHPSIFDKFLQILDDGRLTDGKGETVYFSESIIIFTSNLGTFAPSEEPGQPRRQLVQPEMPYAQVRETILQAIRDHFNLTLGRPEILNRFGENFVVFDFIRPPVDEQIVDRLLVQLINAVAEQQKIQLRLSKPVRDTLVTLARANLQHGGRGIRNILEAALINPLAAALFDQHLGPGSVVRLKRLLDQGEQAGQRFVLELEREGAGK
jgi:MoxR-like ATPase